ncbi:MAG: hydrolase [Anaerolineae bacterium CG2_30_64_16]|nr:MAG: hydrolase [Anaerolineae bacterium CG2_30_64_16]
MSSLLITHGQVFTLGQRNDLIPDGAIYVEGDTIADIGATAALAAKYPTAQRLDAGGKLVLPGAVCGHTHFYGAFARGMAIPGRPATNFVEILERLWWKLDRALLWDDVRYSALVCLVDAIRHGTTTLVDHHASPNVIDGSLDLIADAVKETGLRASLCYEVTDRNGEAGAQAGIAENVRFIQRCQREADPQLGASFGLHAALTLSNKTLEACAAAAGSLPPARGDERGVGFHIHVAEGIADQEESLRLYNMRVVERLQKFGILGPNTIAVHCVHLDSYEKDILRETKTLVTHQPRSNMNNAVGLPDVAGMLRRGIPVALGNDGFSNNMFSEMKAAYLAHKHNNQNPQAMPGDVVMQMAYGNNTNLARRFFPQPVGELSVGAFADIIFLDYHPTTPLSPGNLPWHILFGVDGANVTHTIASGRVLMKDRQLTTLDEAAITTKSRELAEKVWSRIG